MGVRFIAINDSYDSCGEKAQSDALIVPFKNLINDAYCRDISVKIRSQLNIKRKMGDFIGAFAPYGYRKDETNRNRLVVDEEAARTVELIFSLRIQGLCNSAIADRLNSMGILSPMEYKQAHGLNYSCGFRSIEQAQWSPMLVKRILSNESTNQALRTTKSRSVWSMTGVNGLSSKKAMSRSYAVLILIQFRI